MNIPEIEQRKEKAISLNLLSKLGEKLKLTNNFDCRYNGSYCTDISTYTDQDFVILYEYSYKLTQARIITRAKIEFRDELVYDHLNKENIHKVECFKKEDIWLPELKKVFVLIDKEYAKNQIIWEKQAELKEKEEKAQAARKLKKEKEKFGL